MSEASLSPKRPRLDYDDSSGKEDHYDKYKNRDRDHDDQSTFSQSKHRKRSDPDEDDGKEEDGKSKGLNMDTARREHTLVMRLASKEQELQDCMNQIQEMKQAQTQNTAQLRSMLLDPAINLVFQRMAKEMDEHKEKLKQKQNELSAWKFTPDSQTGMRLMAKCRMLLQENGDLGKMISSGRTAKLEGEIALHKALVTEMKKNQKELDEFVGELEEDVEGMQGMIFMLQQQLKEAREQIARLQQENEQLRTLRMPPDPEPGGSMDNSGSNTPLHNWLADSGQAPQLDPAAPTLLSSSLHVENAGNGAISDTPAQRTSPVIPPALSALSGRNKSAVAPSDQLSIAQQSTEEDFPSGTFAFKVTPDSGVQTQEEEEVSMDTDFAASFNEEQQEQQQEQHSDPHQHHSTDALSTRTTPKSDEGGSIKKEITSPQAGVVRTANSPSAIMPPISKCAQDAHDIPDGRLRTADSPTTTTSLAADHNSGTDTTASSSQSTKDVPGPERTTETVNATVAICTQDDRDRLTQLPEEPMDVVNSCADRTTYSDQNGDNLTSKIATAERTDNGNTLEESKAALHPSVEFHIGVKVEDDKKVGLVNGSANLADQGL